MNNQIQDWEGDGLKTKLPEIIIDASSVALDFDTISQINSIVRTEVSGYGLDYCDTLAEKFPPCIVDLASVVRSRITSGVRFTIVDNLGFESLPEEERRAYILGFSRLVGNPTETDKITGRIDWDVTPRRTEYSRVTFSEHDREAEYHTDTQFFPEPENAFSLWSLKHASDGGGVSGIIDGRTVVKHLERTNKKALETLRQTNFPFRVPTVFTQDGRDDSVEILSRPIFGSNPFMRYRKDTIIEGEKSHHPLTNDQWTAIEALEKALSMENFSFETMLTGGQALFANNHELLHSRTSFTDPERHLVRVRFNT